MGRKYNSKRYNILVSWWLWRGQTFWVSDSLSHHWPEAPRIVLLCCVQPLPAFIFSSISGSWNNLCLSLRENQSKVSILCEHPQRESTRLSFTSFPGCGVMFLHFMGLFKVPRTHPTGVWFLFFLNPYLRIYLLIFLRERGRRGNRGKYWCENETSIGQLVAPLPQPWCALTRDWTCNLLVYRPCFNQLY